MGETKKISNPIRHNSKEKTVKVGYVAGTKGGQVWVTTWRVPPPTDRALMVRFGSSVCFAGYEKLIDKWFMLCNGRREEIAAPSLWWCTDENVAPEPEPPLQPRVSLRVGKKSQQLSLKF